MKDFFISYTKADQSWAEWIAWQLEKEGYTTIIQAWDFRAGSNFVSEMQRVTAETDCTIAILTSAFLSSQFTETEWISAFASDPTGDKRKFIMVRVEKVEPPGLLKPRVYVDLVGLNREDASRILLKNIKGERTKPVATPKFPGTVNRLDTSRPNFPGALPPIWNIPMHRNPKFTGRDSFLSSLLHQLNSGHHAALTQAVTGLGGIGKTQIALEYAYRYSTNYDAIWWLRAEDDKTLSADYASFAYAANLQEKDAPEEQFIIAAVRNWLEQNRNWLLIFDNAQKPEVVRQYLPKASTGHVLITSRHHDWETLCRTLSIELWSRDESVEFIKKRTRDNNRSGAERIAEELGDLPLALEQAAAFMNETSIGFNDYLKLYQARRRELWQEENPPLNYPDTVGTTWSLAIKKVQDEAPIGALVLNLCSYFAPDKIPRWIINEASKYLPFELSTIFNDSLSLHKGIKVLNQYSLVNAQSNSLSIYHLVQMVVRDRLKMEEKKLWAETALRAVNAAFPSESYRNPELWSDCAALLSHGQVAIDHAVELAVALEAVANLLNSIASYLHGRASYSDAETFYRRALEIREAQLGADHPDVATSLNSLALLLYAKGSYSDAEPLYGRALEIREAQLGADHLDVATSLNSLALLFFAQGNYTDAEPLYRRALEIREAQLGADHPDVATSLNNIALLLYSQGNYTDAMPFYRRALKIREAQLGADHPDVATSLNSLALLLYAQGNYTEAEPLYRRALHIDETQLGADHPDVATSLNNLALLLQAQGRYPDAEQLFRQALEIRETQLGTNHPDVATSLTNLALLLQARGRYSDAKVLLRRGLEIRGTQLGNDHPDVANIYNNLGEVSFDLRDTETAIGYFKKAISIYQKVFGNNHPDLANSYNNLGEGYCSLGDANAGIGFFKKALSIYQNVFGENHPDVATSYKHLGEGYRSLDDANAAIGFFEKAVWVYQNVFGENHPDVANSYNKIGESHSDLGDAKTAIEFFKKALFIYREIFDHNHPEISNSLNLIGNQQQEMGEYDDAKSHFEEAYIIDKKLFGPRDSRVAEDLIRLGNLSDMYKRFEEAISYYSSALNIVRDNKDIQLESNIKEKIQSLNDKYRLEIREEILVDLDEKQLSKLEDAKLIEREKDAADFKKNLQSKIVLQSLELSNIGFYGNVEWTFQSRINILLGKNGYGKSHLLYCIAALLQKDNDGCKEFLADSSDEVLMTLNVNRGNKEKLIRRSLKRFEAAIGRVPLLAIPDTRMLDKSLSTVGPLREEKASNLQEQGAYHFLRGYPYAGIFEDFLYRICIDYLDNNKDFNRPVFQLIESVVRELADKSFSFHKIIPDGSRFCIQVCTEGNEDYPIPLQKASQGTLSIIAMFGLIHTYLESLGGGSQHDKKSGIVLIDEVDSHLHPAWQRRIVWLLRSKFPYVQFILTAHSPLVVGGCMDGEVAVLRKAPSNGFNLYQFEHDFIGWDTAAIYDRVFEIEEYDESLKHFSSLYLFRDDIKLRIKELENKTDRTSDESDEIEKLHDDLYFAEKANQKSEENLSNRKKKVTKR